MTTIDYDNFIRGQTILQSDTSDHSDALKLLKDKDGIVSYKKSQTFLLLNIGVLPLDERQNPYYEYKVGREGDIASYSVTSTLRHSYRYMIGGKLYDDTRVREFIVCSSMYTECIIRVTFLERPVHEAEFTIHSTIYLLGANLRKEFMNKTVLTTTNVYRDGICSEIKGTTFHRPFLLRKIHNYAMEGIILPYNQVIRDDGPIENLVVACARLEQLDQENKNENQ